MSVAFNARIPTSVRDEIRSLADSDDRSVNWMVTKLLREALDERQRRKTRAGARPTGPG